MRVYKFLDAHFGLRSIEERRLKQSRVSDLNDPFELLPYSLADDLLRITFLKTKKDVDEKKGLLCFSSDWKNPVIWAHYSDKHKGLCLGFEIPELKEDPKDDTGQVEYVGELLVPPSPSNFEAMSDSEHDAFARAAVFTKFNHWSYEKEIRVWGPLATEDNGLHFVACGENMRLLEVIIGQMCPLSKEQIVLALGSLADQVKVIKSRASFDKFEMVEDQQGA